MYRHMTFLQLYNKSCGDTEVPKGYHGWCALGLMAAVLENRVYYEKMGSQIMPNLYVFLVGPASVGKGAAIGKAVKLMHSAELGINHFRGKTTAAFLMDLLGRPIQRDGEMTQPDSRCWLIMDELANDLGQIKQADDFIKLMTELFTATDYPLNTGTRTDGYVSIMKPCVNWTVGTTKEWMFDVMTKQTIYSGFTARVMFCFRDYIDKRIPRPIKPEDHERMHNALINKLRVLYSLEGEMIMDNKCNVMHDKWYMDRIKPNNDLLIPSWKRGHDIILKLAMLFSLDENPTMVIKQHHLRKAITTFENAFADLTIMIDLACGTQESSETDAVERAIKEAKKITRTQLTRKLWSKKINARRIDVYIKDLKDRALVHESKGKAGGVVYEWIGGK